MAKGGGYRTLDLCAGAAGGWSLGVHRAGWKTVAACEIVDARRALYGVNNPGVKLYDDLRNLTGAQLESDLGFLPDIVVGSPPCKEYSSVGRGRGLDADDLFRHAVRLVDECRPRWAAFENSAFVKLRGYDRIADALEAVAYSCWAVVVGSGHAGAAHRRERLVLLATDVSRREGRSARLPRPDPGVAGRAGAGGIERDGRRPAYPLPRLGPIGQAPIERHLRAHDGVPSGVADLCRGAYGDAVSPDLTERVARAIMQVDAAWSDAA